MQTHRVRLDGWKEISAVLRVSERTARRYEIQECLPVHRHVHEKRGSVYAWSDELEAWKQSRCPGAANGASGSDVDPYPAIRSQERAGSGTAATQNPGGRQGHTTPCLPLIGRDDERDSILRAVDTARSGRGSLVVIGGEPGIGKTHLIRTILSEATGKGCFGITGQCRDMEGAPPYAPFIEMLEHCARFVDREAFRQWLGDSAAEVSRLLPGLRQMFVDIPPTVEVPSDQQRRMLFDAFRGFFERSARSRPVVAVFEDLHWADEATVLLFRHLAQLISSIPLLLIATYRSAESDVSRPLTRALEDVYRDRSATRFILRSLSLPAVAAILDQLSGQTAPGWLVHFVFEHTEGNPFFVEELFLDLLLHGKLFDEQGSWRNAFEIGSFNVPQGVRLLIRNRLERLGGNTQRILSLAAILGRSFQIRVLEELEATSSETVLDALDEAERAQLIAPDEPEREPKYHFVHELVRQTLIESSSAPRRQRLHAQVANALERLCADKGESHASALAHHYYEAGAAVHVRQTIAYLVMAARVASASAAHEDALAHIERALSLARSDGLPEVSRLIASKAGVLRSLSRMDEAIDAYESAIHLFSEAGNFAEAAEASHALGHIHLWRADPARARAVVSRGLRVHGMSAPLCRYRLELLNAVSLGMKGDMEAAFEALEKAKEIEPAGPDSSPEIIGYARMCEAHLCYFAARLQTAGECARAAIAAFRQTGNIWAEVEAYEAMSDAVFDDRSGAETEAALSDVLVRAQRIGNQNAIWTYRFMLAELLMHQGRLEQAEQAARQVHHFATSIRAPWAFIDYALLAAIAYYRGDMAEAVRWSLSGLDLEPKCYMSGLLSGSLYLALASQGDPEAECALAAARPHLPVDKHILTFGSSSCLASIAEGLAIAGRIQEAAALENTAEWVVANAPHWLYSRHSFRTSAGIASACARNWTRADEHHRTAVHIADSTGCRVAQPVSRYWHADMLCVRNLPGDRGRARSLLCEAENLAESMSMTWYARQAASRLGR